MTSGVPQGSVLGPLLFLAYVNDLPSVFNSPCLIYADDLKLWRVIRSAADTQILQRDLDVLARWAEIWTLPINVSKCAHMRVSRRPDTALNVIYHIGNEALRHTACERDLGVVLSPSLKTQANTDKVCASARAMTGAIRRSFGRLSPEAF